jgi:hypothetical protein
MLITGTGKAWKIPISTLNALISNHDQQGKCKIEVWSVGSTSVPGDLQLYLSLQTGWCDSLPIDPPVNPGPEPGAGKLWKVSVAALNLLKANPDPYGWCKVEVWSLSSTTLPPNLELWLLLQTGWCDSLPTDPPANPGTNPPTCV